MNTVINKTDMDGDQPLYQRVKYNQKTTKYNITEVYTFRRAWLKFYRAATLSRQLFHLTPARVTALHISVQSLENHQWIFQP